MFTQNFLTAEFAEFSAKNAEKSKRHCSLLPFRNDIINSCFNQI